MSDWINYNGIEIPAALATGEAGQRLSANFRTLADRTVGNAPLIPTVKTADADIGDGDLFMANVEASGNCTFTMPAEPTAGTRLGVTIINKSTFGRFVDLNPNGKTINGASGSLRLDVQYWGVVLQYDGTEWYITYDHRPVARFHGQHILPTNTPGGACPVGAWQTRPMNTVALNESSIGSLSANDITLQKGVYRVDIVSAAFYTKGSRLRLYNVTDATGEFSGQTDYLFTATSGSKLHLSGKLTVDGADTKIYRIQQVVQNSNGGNFGINSNAGGESYLDAIFDKIPY